MAKTELCQVACKELTSKIEDLTTSVTTVLEGMRWLKLAVIGLYSSIGIAIAKTVLAEVLHK